MKDHPSQMKDHTASLEVTSPAAPTLGSSSSTCSACSTCAFWNLCNCSLWSHPLSLKFASSKPYNSSNWTPLIPMAVTSSVNRSANYFKLKKEKRRSFPKSVCVREKVANRGHSQSAANSSWKKEEEERRRRKKKKKKKKKKEERRRKEEERRKKEKKEERRRRTRFQTF